MAGTAHARRRGLHLFKSLLQSCAFAGAGAGRSLGSQQHCGFRRLASLPLALKALPQSQLVGLRGRLLALQLDHLNDR